MLESVSLLPRGHSIPGEERAQFSPGLRRPYKAACHPAVGAASVKGLRTELFSGRSYYCPFLLP